MTRSLPLLSRVLLAVLVLPCSSALSSALTGCTPAAQDGPPAPDCCAPETPDVATHAVSVVIAGPDGAAGTVWLALVREGEVQASASAPIAHTTALTLEASAAAGATLVVYLPEGDGWNPEEPFAAGRYAARDIGEDDRHLTVYALDEADGFDGEPIGTVANVDEPIYGTVRGAVETAAAEVLPEAIVRFERAGRSWAVDANLAGGYELELPEGSYQRTVIAPGFEPLLQTVEVSAGEDSIVDAALQSLVAPSGEDVTLRGEVLDDADGSAIEGASVIVKIGDVPYETTTDTNGAWELSLPRDASGGMLRVEAEGHSSSPHSCWLWLTSESTFDLPPVRLRPLVPELYGNWFQSGALSASGAAIAINGEPHQIILRSDGRYDQTTHTGWRRDVDYALFPQQYDGETWYTLAGLSIQSSSPISYRRVGDALHGRDFGWPDTAIAVYGDSAVEPPPPPGTVSFRGVQHAFDSSYERPCQDAQGETRWVHLLPPSPFPSGALVSVDLRHFPTSGSRDVVDSFEQFGCADPTVEARHCPDSSTDEGCVEYQSVSGTMTATPEGDGIRVEFSAVMKASNGQGATSPIWGHGLVFLY